MLVQQSNLNSNKLIITKVILKWT